VKNLFHNLLALFLTITLISCVTGNGSNALQETRTPVKPQQVILDEKFFDNRNGWEEKTERGLSARITNGRYYLNLWEDNQWGFPQLNTKTDFDRDFTLESSVYRTYGGQTYRHLGIDFDIKNGSNLRTFKINGDGYFHVAECRNGSWTGIVQDTRHPAIKRGFYQTNDLKIERNGDEIAFFVNGAMVFKKRFPEDMHGHAVRLVTEGKSFVQFLNLKITGYEKEGFTPEKISTAPIDFCSATMPDKDGFVFCGGLLKLDVRTGRIWMTKPTNKLADTMAIPYNQYGLIDKEEQNWVNILRDAGMAGIRPWEVPTKEDYDALLSATGTSCISKKSWNDKAAHKYHLPKGFSCVIKQKNNGAADYYHGYLNVRDSQLSYRIETKSLSKSFDNRLAMGFYPVADYYRQFLQDHSNKKTFADSFTKAMAAYQAGLEEPSYAMLKDYLAAHKDRTFNSYLWYKIIETGLPLQYASLPFLYNAGFQGSPDFDMQYAHIANLAANPVGLLYAAEAVKKYADESVLMKVDPSKRHPDTRFYRNAAAIFKALARAWEGNLDDAYLTLLQEVDFKANYLGLAYLNKYGGPLLHDKKKLAAVLRIPEAWLIGTPGKRPSQAIYNPYDGSLIPVSGSAMPVQSAPASTPAQSGGATILD